MGLPETYSFISLSSDPSPAPQRLPPSTRKANMCKQHIGSFLAPFSKQFINRIDGCFHLKNPTSYKKTLCNRGIFVLKGMELKAQPCLL